MLSQVEGSDIPEGGWVGGDAWFGSRTTAIEVYNSFRLTKHGSVKIATFFFQWGLYMKQSRQGTKNYETLSCDEI